jgi:hypothetical protein
VVAQYRTMRKIEFVFLLYKRTMPIRIVGDIIYNVQPCDAHVDCQLVKPFGERAYHCEKILPVGNDDGASGLQDSERVIDSRLSKVPREHKFSKTSRV